MDTDLTPEVRAKRVAVARDVLAQLDRQDVPLKLRGCVYLSGAGDIKKTTVGSQEDRLDYLQSHCDVCMLGAAFLSYGRLFGCDLSQVESSHDRIFMHDDNMRDALRVVFDRHTLELMESVFERCNMADPDAEKPRSDACEAAGDWGKQFATSDGSGRAICQNLIDNNGELLIPSQEPANV